MKGGTEMCDAVMTVYLEKKKFTEGPLQELCRTAAKQPILLSYQVRIDEEADRVAGETVCVRLGGGYPLAVNVTDDSLLALAGDVLRAIR
jgi:hypothetical protein